jgi:hypothetical protein
MSEEAGGGASKDDGELGCCDDADDADDDCKVLEGGRRMRVAPNAATVR